jgi:hypothetical protein
MPFTFAFQGAPSCLAQACLPLLRLARAHTHAATALVLERTQHLAQVIAFSGQPLTDTPAPSLGQWPDTEKHFADRQAITGQPGLDLPNTIQALTLLPLAEGKALLCLLYDRAQVADGNDQSALADITRNNEPKPMRSSTASATAKAITSGCAAAARWWSAIRTARLCA